MSIQLKDQIRHHYRAVDTAQEAVDYLEIVERVEMPVVPAPVGPPGGRAVLLRRPVVIAAMAFAAVVIAALPFLLREPTDPVVASTLPTAPTIVTPTTTPAPPTTPESVAQGPVTGGVVTWSEVNQPPPLPGEEISFLSGPEGVIRTLDRSGPTNLSIWSSSDGVDWTNTSTAIPRTSWDFFESTPSGYWVIGWGPTSLWFSPSARPGTWEEINVEDIGRPAPEGLMWEENFLRPARVDETTLLPVEFRLDFDWEAILGIDRSSYLFLEEGFESETTDVLTVWGVTEVGSETLAHVEIDETSAGLTLADDDTGEELLFVPRGTQGLDGEMLAELGGWRTFSLFAVTPDGVVESDLWSGVAGNPGNPWAVQAYEFEDSVVVWAGSEEGGTSYITSDGFTFQSHPSPPFEFASVTNDTDSGYLHASTWGLFAATHWISSDSVNWSLLDVDSTLSSRLYRLDNAWLVIRNENEGALADTHYISFDGETWHPLTDLPTGFNPDQLALVWADRILLVSDQTAWLGSLEVTR